MSSVTKQRRGDQTYLYAATSVRVDGRRGSWNRSIWDLEGIRETIRLYQKGRGPRARHKIAKMSLGQQRLFEIFDRQRFAPRHWRGHYAKLKIQDTRTCGNGSGTSSQWERGLVGGPFRAENGGPVAR